MGTSSDARLQYQNQFIATDADRITTQTANTDEILLAETTWDEVINGMGATVGTDDDFIPAATNADDLTASVLTDTAAVAGDVTDTDLPDIASTAPTGGNAGDLAIRTGTTGAGLYIASGATPTYALITSLSQFFTSAGAKWLGVGTLAESGSSGVNSVATAKAWLDSNIAGDIPSDTTYFYLDGTTLNKATASDFTESSGSPAAARKFHPVQPLIIESSLRGGGENIPLPYKTGNSAMTKDAPGPISVEEGLVFAGTGDGMEMFYRMMTQTRNPDVVDIGSGQDSSKQTLLAAGALNDVLSDAAVTGVTAPTLVNLSELNDGVDSGKIPVRLDLTPSSAAAISGIGLVQIRGKDKDGLDIQEYVVWNATDIAKTDKSKKTRNYYVSVTNYVSSGWTAGTLEIACTDTSKKVTYTPQDDELVAFWFIRLVRGITPTLFSGVIGNSFEVALGRDTALEWNVTCLGKRSWPNTNIRGVAATNPAAGPASGGRVPIDDSIGFADPSIFTGWQCELDIGGTRMALIDSTLSINQNLENSGVITGDRYEETRPFRGTDREVMLDGTVVYSPENNLSQVYLDNTTLEDVQLNLRNRPRGGFYWLTRFVFPTTQINTNPDPASPRDGRISQTFNLKCFTEGIGGGPKDYRIETFVPHHADVRNFRA